jgi:hypothetical protein
MLELASLPPPTVHPRPSALSSAVFFPAHREVSPLVLEALQQLPETLLRNMLHAWHELSHRSGDGHLFLLTLLTAGPREHIAIPGWDTSASLTFCRLPTSGKSWIRYEEGKPWPARTPLHPAASVNC